MIKENAINDFTLKAVLKKYDVEKDASTPFLQTITDYKNGQSNLFSTYDEHIKLSDNSQNSLSFKLIMKNKTKINPFISLLVIGRELQLYWENKYYYFVITSRTPNFLKDNVEFSFECQDSLSYYLSHNNVSFDFADEKESIDLQYSGKNIKELAVKILEESNLSEKWKIDSDLASKKKLVASFPNTIFGNTNSTIETTATLELQNSNTYNALIELANIFNGLITVKYNENPLGPHIISFINKNYPHKTYHRLSPSVNLNRFNLNESGNEMCTLLNVIGGEVNGQVVSILPPIPSNVIKVYGYLFQLPDYQISESFGSSEDLEKYNKDHNSTDTDLFEKIMWNNEDIEFFNVINKRVKTASSMLYNFDYFEETGQLDSAEKDRIEKILNYDYRNENLKLQIFSNNYFVLLEDYNNAVAREEELIYQLAGLYENKIQNFLDNTANNTINVSINQGTPTANKDESSLPDNMMKQTLDENIESKITNVYSNLYNLWSSNYVRPRCLMGYTLDKTVAKDLKLTLEQQNAMTFMDKIKEEKKYLRKKKIEEYKKLYSKAVEILGGTDPSLLKIENDYVQYSNAKPGKKVELLRDTNLAAYVEYSDLKQRMSSMSLFLDKKISVEGKEIIGYGIYTCYELVLDLFSQATKGVPAGIENVEKIKKEYEYYSKDEGNKDKDYLAIYESAQKKKDEIWQDLLSKHDSFFIEGVFEDSSQTDSNGLYCNAIAQFTKYSHPSLDYSAETVDWDLILADNITPLQVGDILTVDGQGFNLGGLSAMDHNIVVRFETSKDIGLIQQINGISIKKLQNYLFEGIERKPTPFKEIKFLRSYNNNGRHYVELFFSMNKNEDTHLDYSFIQFLNNSRVLNYDILRSASSLDLMVTGIDKTLRDNVTKLNISNETAMSSVVQRILLRTH